MTSEKLKAIQAPLACAARSSRMCQQRHLKTDLTGPTTQKKSLK